MNTIHHYEVVARDAQNVGIIMHTSRTLEDALDYRRTMSLDSAHILAVYSNGDFDRMED
jgi:hypothetical protein